MKTFTNSSLLNGRRRRVLMALLFSSASLALAHASEVITVPVEFQNTQGNVSDGSALFGQPLPLRFQQAFDSSAIGPLLGPILIKELRFRNDSEQGGPFSGTIGSVEVRMSSIAYPAGQMSEVLDLNIGADEAVVFARGPLAISSLSPVVSLTAPFLYQPSNGGLLIEIRKYTSDAIFPSYLDANAYPGSIGPISYATAYTNPDLAKLGSVHRGAGLVFEIAFDVVPEPSTLALAAVAFIVIIIWRFQRT